MSRRRKPSHAKGRTSSKVPAPADSQVQTDAGAQGDEASASSETAPVDSVSPDRTLVMPAVNADGDAADSAGAAAVSGAAASTAAAAAAASAGATTKKSHRVSNVLSTLFAVALLVVGVAVLLYPEVSNYLAERQQLNAISQYEDDVAELDEEDLSAEWAAAQEYNEDLAGDPVHDPFVVGSGYALPDNYEEVLNVNDDGIMGYIEIPDIDVLLPIYHGTSDEVLEKGVGHIDYTSLPIGGDSTHCVLSAHRGLPSAELFTRLGEMEIGDVFYLHVLDEVHAYEVDEIQVVEPDDLSQITIEEGEDQVTLLTCTPYGVNTHRLLVTGHRVAYEPDEDADVVGDAMDWLNLILVIVGIVIGLIIVAVIFGVRHHRKKKRLANGQT